MSTVVRIARYFVWRLLLTMGLGDKKGGTDNQLAAVPKGTRIIPGGEFHAALDWCNGQCASRFRRRHFIAFTRV